MRFTAVTPTVTSSAAAAAAANGGKASVSSSTLEEPKKQKHLPVEQMHHHLPPVAMPGIINDYYPSASRTRVKRMLSELSKRLFQIPT